MKMVVTSVPDRIMQRARAGGRGGVFTQAFDGEPFDPRDKGGGSKWMFWYKGRAAKRKRGRYDFRK